MIALVLIFFGFVFYNKNWREYLKKKISIFIPQWTKKSLYISNIETKREMLTNVLRTLFKRLNIVTFALKIL